MPIVRVREHVNPLSKKYQVAIAPPDWQTIYADLTRPLHLDIGCGKGRFLLEMAQQQPNWNYLGLEIREPLVEQANDWRRELSLTNLHYLFCNANNSLRPLLSSLPQSVLHTVTIQFPDPWFKRRHQKRRVVQPELVTDLATFLVDGGTVFVQSDVEEVALEMRDRFDEHPAFVRQHADWLPNNPMPVQTERELLVLSFHDPVYRAIYTHERSQMRS
ncbi:MAG: tRNA (guanosine(46)-N7)-methyltransferase TrmB [Oscillatoriales cyanobacterium C42_A2020_001]|nr:tRNA (guanosine(46)-N7)-methyltransferase TrmB [Leptolyngbyaceae cyanobacterium C42_A2020_001]